MTMMEEAPHGFIPGAARREVRPRTTTIGAAARPTGVGLAPPHLPASAAPLPLLSNLPYFLSSRNETPSRYQALSLPATSSENHNLLQQHLERLAHRQSHGNSMDALDFAWHRNDGGNRRHRMRSLMPPSSNRFLQRLLLRSQLARRQHGNGTGNDNGARDDLQLQLQEQLNLLRAARDAARFQPFSSSSLSSSTMSSPSSSLLRAAAVLCSTPVRRSSEGGYHRPTANLLLDAYLDLDLDLDFDIADVDETEAEAAALGLVDVGWGSRLSPTLSYAVGLRGTPAVSTAGGRSRHGAVARGQRRGTTGDDTAALSVVAAARARATRAASSLLPLAAASAAAHAAAAAASAELETAEWGCRRLEMEIAAREMQAQLAIRRVLCERGGGGDGGGLGGRRQQSGGGGGRGEGGVATTTTTTTTAQDQGQYRRQQFRQQLEAATMATRAKRATQASQTTAAAVWAAELTSPSSVVDDDGVNAAHARARSEAQEAKADNSYAAFEEAKAATAASAENVDSSSFSSYLPSSYCPPSSRSPLLRHFAASALASSSASNTSHLRRDGSISNQGHDQNSDHDQRRENERFLLPPPSLRPLSTTMTTSTSQLPSLRLPQRSPVSHVSRTTARSSPTARRRDGSTGKGTGAGTSARGCTASSSSSSSSSPTPSFSAATANGAIPQRHREGVGVGNYELSPLVSQPPPTPQQKGHLPDAPSRSTDDTNPRPPSGCGGGVGGKDEDDDDDDDDDDNNKNNDKPTAATMITTKTTTTKVAAPEMTTTMRGLFASQMKLPLLHRCSALAASASASVSESASASASVSASASSMRMAVTAEEEGKSDVHDEMKGSSSSSPSPSPPFSWLRSGGEGVEVAALFALAKRPPIIDATYTADTPASTTAGTGRTKASREVMTEKEVEPSDIAIKKTPSSSSTDKSSTASTITAAAPSTVAVAATATTSSATTVPPPKPLDISCALKKRRQRRRQRQEGKLNQNQDGPRRHGDQRGPNKHVRVGSGGNGGDGDADGDADVAADVVTAPPSPLPSSVSATLTISAASASTAAPPGRRGSMRPATPRRLRWGTLVAVAGVGLRPIDDGGGAGNDNNEEVVDENKHERMAKWEKRGAEKQMFSQQGETEDVDPTTGKQTKKAKRRNVVDASSYDATVAKTTTVAAATMTTTAMTTKPAKRRKRDPSSSFYAVAEKASPLIVAPAMKSSSSSSLFSSSQLTTPTSHHTRTNVDSCDDDDEYGEKEKEDADANPTNRNHDFTRDVVATDHVKSSPVSPRTPQRSAAAAIANADVNESDTAEVSTAARRRNRAAPRNNCLGWDGYLARFREYKAATGDTNVPKRHRPDPSLGHWCANQRRYRAAKMAGRRTPLTDERERILSDMGFEWLGRESHESACDARWWERFDELRAYKERVGHCRVSKEHPVHKSLGLWVRTQRKAARAYREMMAAGTTLSASTTREVRAEDEEEEEKKKALGGRPMTEKRWKALEGLGLFEDYGEADLPPSSTNAVKEETSM